MINNMSIEENYQAMDPFNKTGFTLTANLNKSYDVSKRNKVNIS